MKAVVLTAKNKRGIHGLSPKDDRLSTTLTDEVRSAIRQHLGLAIRSTQIDAARFLLGQSIVEMQTGEGKTLSIATAAIEMASSKRRVIVATANDYLATRDANLLQPVFQSMGLTVASITADLSAAEKRVAYAADVVYGTLRQYGFDYLVQRMEQRQRDSRNPAASERDRIMTLDVLLVDEADSVLIDEARTPLVISSSPLPGKTDCETDCEVACRWAADVAKTLTPDVDFVVSGETDAIALTETGHRKVLRSTMPAEMAAMTTTDIVQRVETAVCVSTRYRRDQHYIVTENQIQLVDEFTGRSQFNRTFAAGIHQAIQAREGLTVTPPAMPIAQMTIQDFIARFDHLAGMTATAWEDRREIAEVYGLSVRRIAPWKRSQRVEYPAITCESETTKFASIADEIQSVIASGRAVLVGTRTIEKSELLSGTLRSRGLQHVVLNARHVDQEAELVQQAGTPGRITVATNMAGRGTDIPLEASVAAAGGLHVIVSEPHSASRIDRQLIGRAARQGDPGSYRYYLSIEDEILDQAYGRTAADALRRTLHGSNSENRVRWQLRRAQSAVARMHRRSRHLLAMQSRSLAQQMSSLGLDPQLDPISESQ